MNATLDHAISPMLRWYWQLGSSRYVAALPIMCVLMVLLLFGLVLSIATWGRL